MSRLIVVSNRVPDPKRAPSGGLAVALKSALEQRGGVWMGWSGKSCGTTDPAPFETHIEHNITYALTQLSDRDFAEYYQGFANSVLWPLCHYRLDLTDYARRDMAGYFRVNRLFAQRLAPLVQPDDVIWIHDYHLLPLAAELRRMGLGNRLGFFMHIPWPSPEVFLTLPIAEQILRDMAAYDLIGFQTADDAENFALCLRRSNLGQPVAGSPDLHRLEERIFRIGAFPISIDVAEIARNSTQSGQSPRMRRLRDTLRGQKLIVGVDRLDYSKGIPQRLAGYRRFLEDNPAWHGQVSYLQITPKSREGVSEYDALQREVAEMSGALSGAYGNLDWSPMRYVNHAFSQNILAGVYNMAQVALVTPLRDGMNLVAKEYVAAQDAADPGVLVLSRFAGAAHELGQGALLINPYDTESIANALARAISMPLAERRERHAAMLARIKANTVFDWCDSYLAALAGPPATRSAEGLRNAS